MQRRPRRSAKRSRFDDDGDDHGATADLASHPPADGAAHDLFERYLPLLRYEAQGEWGIAIRKEVMRQRGALRCSALRMPGPVLSAVDKREIATMIERQNTDFRFDAVSAD